MSVGRLFAFAAGVVGLVVLGVLGSAVVFHFFVRHTHPWGRRLHPLRTFATLPPELRLQTAAPLDLKRYRDDQEKILAGIRVGGLPKPALSGFLLTAPWICFCKKGTRSVAVPR